MEVPNPAAAQPILVAPPLSFNDVAKTIIKKAIRAAVCIDDMFIEPYMTDEDIESSEAKLPLNQDGSKATLERAIPSSLYKSFRQQGECDLDIYNFKSYDDTWKPHYILSNKDLLVIDWELDINSGHESTLKIIKDVINGERVPFIIIYTYLPKSRFSEIATELIQNFNHYSKDSIKTLKVSLLEKLAIEIQKMKEDTSIDELKDTIEIILESEDVLKHLDNIIFNPNNHEDSYNEILKTFRQELDIEEEHMKGLQRKVSSALKETFNCKTDKFNLEHLCYVLKDSNSAEEFILNRIDIEEIGFKINDTIITLFSKPSLNNNETTVTPENVFNQFSNLISSSPHNFITLLSLEMRHRLKEDIRKIGAHMSAIDEKAFFKHMDNYKTKEEFYDFLLRSWINELSEYNLNIKPLIFATIEQYRLDNNLTNINSAEILEALANLGCKLSTLTVPNREVKDKKIRFGDIFEVTILGQGSQAASTTYLLSLTPHCVCADPTKIENNFYFIKSKPEQVRLNTAVKDIEKKFYSFIQTKESLLAIEWECKPFTIYIAENDLSKLAGSYKDSKVQLKYVTTLKENYAQRIANNSFAYGTAIGIDLPH